MATVMVTVMVTVYSGLERGHLCKQSDNNDFCSCHLY